jgi:predicted transposase YbfD/YdcC
MNSLENATLVDHFSRIPDFRCKHNKRHKLVDIMVITICAVIGGANDWNAIETFGKAKIAWLQTFLELPNGIPSHDTFRRVFSILSPNIFQDCFLSWINSVVQFTHGQVVAIDGKTLRRSHDKGSGKTAIHMVSAWATENGVVMGQVKTEEKSNEIIAIPELLKVLDISGSIVTIDAMGCQKKIVDQIIGQGGDYVIGLKGNQGNLLKEAEKLFCEINDNDFDYFETEEKGHGRVETRSYWVTDAIDFLSQKGEWRELNTIGMVESVREENGKASYEYRFYIGSIEKDAECFAGAVRKHWGIENQLHWSLDMVFREDESRMRKGNSAENFAVVRHIAANLLGHEKTAKLGKMNKRLKAAWDDKYLAKVLTQL